MSPHKVHICESVTSSFICSSVTILESHLQSNVQYVSVPPTVSLDIGKALNLNDLEEGDDVYFECSISANPPPYKVTWLHDVSPSNLSLICNKNLSQGKEILQKPEMQIFVSNQSLVLQKVIFLHK